MRSCLLALMVCLAFLVMCLDAAAPPRASVTMFRLPTSEEKQRINTLIRQLGSDDFETREKATRALLLLDSAVVELRKVKHSPDTEVKRRAQKILATLTQRRVQATLRLMQANAKAGEADMLAERIVCWEGEDDASGCWQPMLDLCYQLVKIQSNEFKRPPRHHKALPLVDFTDQLKKFGHSIVLPPEPTVTIRRPLAIDSTSVFVARGERVVAESEVSLSLIVSAKATSLLGCSGFVLSGGDVSMKEGGGIVVCDGDFTTERMVPYSMIIARGGVRVPRVQGSVILAGGDVSFIGDARDRTVMKSTIHCAGNVNLNGVRVVDSEIKPHQTNVFGPIKFFDPADLGIVVEPTAHAVRVARAEKAFAIAGLKPGDRVAELDGREVTSPEAFRRALRRSVALDGVALLRVRRDARWLEIEVPLAR